ncbi:MAG: glycerol-3-phosphate 1-O-acyltransferase PlsY [Clostridia bacterium]|nr:glycerol-3-phosphate 1-O-acyltransferase PlsY [Clostridia bacterium]
MSYNFNQGLLAALAPLLDPTVFMILYLVFTLVTMAAAYLLGSVNTSIIVSRLLYGDDIRKHGSGNAGLTNTLRTYGGKAALLTLFGDIFKAVLAILISGVLLGFNYVGGIATADGPYIAGLFAVLGHIFPVYYKFKGGKGVLVTATVALVLSPIPFAILFVCFALILCISHYVSLASVTSAVLYPVVLYGYMRVCFPTAQMPGMMALTSILIAIIVVFCHRENLKRIGNRTERTFSFKRRPKTDDGTTDTEAKDTDNRK